MQTELQYFHAFYYCDNFLAFEFMNYESYSCIHVSYMQKPRVVKMDDIYIYNMYTLSLLLATFQIKQRRGRLCFQKGEDDEDMTTLDTTKNIAYMHICEVISNANKIDKVYMLNIVNLLK